MRCHECSRQADLAVEHEGVTVGLCEKHFAERLSDLSESDWFGDIVEHLDV